jgi:hypothetical protein
MARFEGSSHIWRHTDKYSGSVKEIIQQTVDFETTQING